RPGVPIRAQAAEYLIRQPSFLAHVLKQPRAHRATEDGVHDVAGVPVLVILTVAGGAKTDVALLQFLVANDGKGNDPRWSIGDRRRLRWQRLERSRDKIAHLRMIHIPDRGDD